MVELDQFRYRISGYDKPMAQIKNSLDLDNKQKRIEELEADMESPGFWDNPDKSQNAMKELKGLKDAFERYNELETGLDDVKTLIEMAEESNDQSLIPEIEEEIMGLEDKMESLRIETLLSGEHDACDAILTLHAECRDPDVYRRHGEYRTRFHEPVARIRTRHGHHGHRLWLGRGPKYGGPAGGPAAYPAIPQNSHTVYVA